LSQKSTPFFSTWFLIRKKLTYVFLLRAPTEKGKQEGKDRPAAGTAGDEDEDEDDEDDGEEEQEDDDLFVNPNRRVVEDSDEE